MVFPGVIAIPAVCYEDRDRRSVAAAAEDEARAMGKDTDTIWTDGSRLDDGRVGVGIAWLEGRNEGSEGRIVTTRRDYRTAGQRREKRRGYLDGSRTMIAHRPGWRSSGFRMGGGREAYDAELAAVVHALVHLHERGQEGHDYTIFTDSTAAMRRMTGDSPGPGQDMAIRAIEIAERLVQGGNTITMRWTPAHVGVEGNERADLAAKDAATLPPLRGTRKGLSLAFLKRQITDGVCERWISDTTTRMEKKGAHSGAFVGPDRRARPRIRTLLRKTRKGVASRYFQLLSGHAMIVPFLKERYYG